MDSHTSLLSIVTVVYNDAENFVKTIRSIRSQTFQGFELIVIDGGSKDDTLNIIHANQDLIRFWISEPDGGIYDAMNKGLFAARGHFVEFLNAGDTYSDAHALSRIFTENAWAFDALYGEINLLDRNDRFQFKVPAKDFTLENLKRYGTGTLNHQAFFIRREMAPFFSTRFRLKSELNWYFDILEKNRSISYKHIPVPIIDYRQGGKGYEHFWRNLFEWITLIHSRFGFIENIRNIQTYWNFIKYRYPSLKVLSKS